MAPIERSCETGKEPSTSVQWSPPSVLLYRPSPAWLIAFASPVPAYSVLPDGSVGSTISAPNAFVGSPLSIAVQATWPAFASSVRHRPPPAAATHRRQPFPGAPQLGSIASAVTRPEVIESFRLSVVGAGAKPVVGPRNVQSAPTSERAIASRTPERKSERSRRVGSPRVTRVACRTAPAGMYLRGYARLTNASLTGVTVPGLASLSGSRTSNLDSWPDSRSRSPA